jgi:hypothetical protein
LLVVRPRGAEEGGIIGCGLRWWIRGVGVEVGKEMWDQLEEEKAISGGILY